MDTQAQETQRSFMLHALELSRRGVGRVSPNPPVGAVAVRDGSIIAEGWHEEYGGPHAEAQLVRSCPDLSGADVFVTLEPCAHQGKTPPCSRALIDSRCKRVFYGVEDPNPKTAGRGPGELTAAGIEVSSGLCDDEIRRLLAPYLHWTKTRRPLVTAKWAMTLDGHIATTSGDSKWISSEAMRAHTRGERFRYDAILVGIGTASADDPSLLGTEPGCHPLRVVVDSNLTLDPGCQLVRSASESPVLVAACREADDESRFAESGVEVVTCPDERGGVDVSRLLDVLGERGVAHLLVEGGAKIHGAFLDARLVDRVQAIVAPKVIGGSGQAPIAGRGLAKMAEAFDLAEMELTRVGDDWVIEGALTRAGLGL